MIRAILIASLVALVALSVVPGAEARPPAVGACVVGDMNDDPNDCVVTYWTVQCVTFPCDPIKLCVAYGTLCL